MFVDHVGDLSSSKNFESFLSFLLFQVDFFPDVRLRQDFLQSPCDIGVQHLEVRIMFSCRRESWAVSFSRSHDSAQMDGKKQNKLRGFLKKHLQRPANPEFAA